RRAGAQPAGGGLCPAGRLGGRHVLGLRLQRLHDVPHCHERDGRGLCPCRRPDPARSSFALVVPRDEAGGGQQEAATRGRRRELALILLLAAVTATGPFTLHALSPALPAVSAGLEVSAAAAQLLLSLSLVAMAVSTLAWGPLSDRYGRRPVLLVGMVVATLGSALAAVAPSLWVAILGRLLQAGGAAAGMVLARAVAQDVFGTARAAGVIGQMTAFMVAAPMVAPTVSGLIVASSDWRGVFWMTAVLCAGLVIWT